MTFRRSVLVGVLLFLGANLGPSSPATAQDDVEAAKAHFHRGTRLYEVGEYRQALEEYKTAHLAKPDPAFLYNIAQCHRQLGDLEQAVTMYKRFLAASPNTVNRGEVEKRVAELEGELAKRKSVVDAQSAQVPTSVPAPSPPPPLAPPPPDPVVAVPPLAVAAQPSPAESSLRYLRWLGVGVTAALVGGAIATGVSASSKYDDLKNTCGNTPEGCTDSQVNPVKSRALVTNILWALAGTAAVGTGVMFVLTPHESVAQVAWSF
jgi:tetratricopeptide (TPR) repeat protein